MSNKAISVYAEAAKRQKEEEKKPLPGTFAKLMASTPPPESPKGAENKSEKRPEKKQRNKAILQASKQYYNIAILQFSDEDVSELRKGGYEARTFRLSGRDIEWLRDTAYSLSKELKKKVTQADIVRVSTKVFEKLLKGDKERVKEILNRMK